MIANFAANILEALTAPRRSVRRLLRADLSLSDCLLMVVLAVLINAIIADLMGFISPSFAVLSGGGLGMRVVETGVQIVAFFILSGLAYAVGERFGGKGSLRDLRVAVAWHALTTSFLAPLNVIGVSGITPDGRLGATFPLMALAVGVSIWIFASFVAEAHGFKKIGGVIGATIMGFMLFGVVASVLKSIVTGGA